MQVQGPNADQRFVQYYAEQSASEGTRQRFESTRRVTLALRAEFGLPIQGLDVLDVGCGAGAQAMMWAESGHRAQGIDISSPLIDLARERARSTELKGHLILGGAMVQPLLAA